TYLWCHGAIQDWFFQNQHKQMTVTRSEIEERWLGHTLQDHQVEPILECYNRVEQVLGRPWLEASVIPGVVGSSILLPIYVLGDHLRLLARAAGAEKLIRRLQAREPAAHSELYSIALCVDGDDVEIEIEPPVGASGKVPDFRVRRPGEGWVWVEATKPSY